MFNILRKKICWNFVSDFVQKKHGLIFGVKSNLHSSKTVKDFLTKFSPVIYFANLCNNKKPEVSVMFWKEDIKILVTALFRKFWLYIPRWLYITTFLLSTVFKHRVYSRGG
jgi:hypothetical protein